MGNAVSGNPENFFCSQAERTGKGNFWRGGFYLPPISKCLGKKF